MTLASGKTVTIDEKVRAKSYPDIALERWSDVARQTSGWIQKDLACDFIAYAFVPDERCYRIVDAQNDRYTTQSVAVPIPDLLSAVSQALIVDWSRSP